MKRTADEPAAVLHFGEDGSGAGLYSEVIDLQKIGPLDITRASTLEFNAATQQWEVVDFMGRLVHTNRSRGECLAWERRHFNGPAWTPPATEAAE